MRVENIRTLPADSAWIEKSKAGSAATAKALPSKNNKEAQEPQRLLQNYSRSADEIQQDIEKVNGQLKSMNRSIRFIIDDQSNDIVVKVVDENTGEVIMEIPPEEVLNLRERLREMSGLLVEKQV
ncbi:MAG TPA: flagellar protein FlaG [Deltaproteobacteria bacterium]|jgi:flagellar protein FlaG|nr:flagellar protein FlaG [Deltaproteobacteria bacterium]